MQDLITIAAEEYIDTWNNKHSHAIPYIPHKFDLTGKVAGQFWPRKENSWFRWNMKIANENSDDYLYQTVGHEVAHWIVHNINPCRSRPHGHEWQSVMRTLGLEPKRCHNYTVKAARTVKRPFQYLCPCGEHHKITATKFKNMVMRGLDKNGLSSYYCHCNTRINIKHVKPISQENH